VAVGLLVLVVGDDLGVQGRSDSQRELLDAESVAGHLLKAGSVFAFLAAHRRELFPDEISPICSRRVEAGPVCRPM
jgi:hypothetical protein